ncbi:MAG: hypothetical protein AB7D39_11830 [Pseudodesulfovibrio sp.]|uniref:hypothetical protein n=1 Tax=Pseudodesulfovibrio sp. TaxID=2035812 RepID=UPI003D09C07D
MGLRKFIRDVHVGVWAGLALLAVTTAFPLLYSHYSGNPENEVAQIFIAACDWIIGVFTSIWRWVVDPHPVPGYGLIILILLSAGCLLGICLILYGQLQEEPLIPPEPPNEAYLFGAKWRLHWRGNSLTDVVPYCTICDGILEHVHYETLSCINCHRNAVKVPYDDIPALKTRVAEEVLRRLRNDLPL